MLFTIVTFILFILLQGLMINGIRAAMAGTTEKMPNGKDKDSEEIFYPFFKYITQKTEKKVYYEGVQFLKLRDELYEKYLEILPKAENLESDAGYLQFNTNDQVELIKRFARILLREMQIHTDIDGRHVRFYKVYDEYKFSKWLRKPFGQCIKCMASVYGTVTYWPTVLLVFGFEWWQVPMFIADVFILVHVNYLLFKK